MSHLIQAAVSSRRFFFRSSFRALDQLNQRLVTSFGVSLFIERHHPRQSVEQIVRLVIQTLEGCAGVVRLARKQVINTELEQIGGRAAQRKRVGAFCGQLLRGAEVAVVGAPAPEVPIRVLIRVAARIHLDELLRLVPLLECLVAVGRAAAAPRSRRSKWLHPRKEAPRRVDSARGNSANRRATLRVRDREVLVLKRFFERCPPLVRLVPM